MTRRQCRKSAIRKDRGRQLSGELFAGENARPSGKERPTTERSRPKTQGFDLGELEAGPRALRRNLAKSARSRRLENAIDASSTDPSDLHAGRQGADRYAHARRSHDRAHRSRRSYAPGTQQTR